MWREIIEEKILKSRYWNWS